MLHGADAWIAPASPADQGDSTQAQDQGAGRSDEQDHGDDDAADLGLYVQSGAEKTTEIEAHTRAVGEQGDTVGDHRRCPFMGASSPNPFSGRRDASRMEGLLPGWPAGWRLKYARR